MLGFILLKNKLARIYKPKTYLVPEKERTDPPPRSPWGWLFAIFRIRDREVINKCGLDAYFFLRYLRTLLVIFIPLGVVLLPILLPLNSSGGRGSSYALEWGNDTSSTHANVTGLDELAWGNVRPTHTNRYWAHLVLAFVVIMWVCGVFFSELRVYVKVRQDYLTTAEHRLRASATTVLVSAIPGKWLSEKALWGLYDVFPGGIRNVWINRNFDKLLEKIKQRDNIFRQLEGAETQLIRDAKKSQRKQLEKANKDKARSASKQERAQRLELENQEAERLAKSGGQSSGDGHVPHTVDDVIDEEEERSRNDEHINESQGNRKGGLKLPGLPGFIKPAKPILGGLAAVGDTVMGGARNLGRDIDNTVGTTNGFTNIDGRSIIEDDRYDQYGRYRPEANNGPYGDGVDEKDLDEKVRAGAQSLESSRDGNPNVTGIRLPGNETRRVDYGLAADSTNQHVSDGKWWKFWRGPSGGFASPIPMGYEDLDEFPLTQNHGTSAELHRDAKSSSKPKEKGFGAKIKSLLPFLNSEEIEPLDYPIAHNKEYKEDAEPAAWEKFLKEKDRPTHRLPRFDWTPGFLPGLPLVNKKVDTIYWARGELARLNLEIDMDQKHPERFPLMNSAFIQFNHQMAAHMAAQSISHHVPQQMAPRMVEIAPNDVIWDNMSIKWWEAWGRSALVTAIVVGMVILWAFPVAWTATLSQISTLSEKYSWLRWLDAIPPKVLQAIAGVLPAIVLGILLAVVPMIMGFLGFISGAQTGRDKARSVQIYYFAFLFVQVFLVVSISGGITAAISSAINITSIPETLAVQLPKAANYFFSYMILQALSTSSGNLLQILTLILWYVLPKLQDDTARQKWTRNTRLPTVNWGQYFPVYTNFACIAIIYSVVAPIIIIFAIITFSLLYMANRYNMLYVNRFQLDTGGLLYPRAINQTFTGLYFMEVCLVGLFFLVRDENGKLACSSQAIIMIVAIFLTVLYQYLLNMSFGPLFQHLPITCEDEAVIRDQIFENAQARRPTTAGEDTEACVAAREDIEMSRLNKPTSENTHPKRQKRKHRDAEAQKKIADALYGGINDEIEDLSQEERDILVHRAFQHVALRARRPTIWLPRDDIGVSDDEIKRTREFAGKNIYISNVGAALDGKSRVVYGMNPPDFSETDIINL
ncbi:hypothetical protein BJ875DRAFT_375275 [Amylocarpus encephaloides]|uniref:DUF221-domain-containing protein n=1 Tax=Amylocarpus encephaloides TaxID=45428 RepID=A0A9P7YJL6_9HELO|nr:hypothetical protein BJ875DRAFT_375275 [Amylocarpus encephaloides]